MDTIIANVVDVVIVITIIIIFIIITEQSKLTPFFKNL